MNIKEYIRNPGRIVLSLGNHELVNWMPDKQFISLAFHARMGRKLDWNNLQTFNEKQQWLKLYDRNPMYHQYVDKYEVRKVVADKIGEEYLIPIIGVWDDFDEIEISRLPNQFVMKCTHDSGSVVICKDKNTFDFSSAEKIIRKAMKRNFYMHSREWPYKGLKPRIIVEELLQNEDGKEVSDYKLQCFHGKFDNSLVCVNRYGVGGVKYFYFDREWKLLPYSIYQSDYDSLKNLIPQNYEKMIEFAEILSEGVPELRVDFYEVNGKIYFGELTFFSSGGCDTTITYEADLLLGKKLLLPSCEVE